MITIILLITAITYAIYWYTHEDTPNEEGVSSCIHLSLIYYLITRHYFVLKPFRAITKDQHPEQLLLQEMHDLCQQIPVHDFLQHLGELTLPHTGPTSTLTLTLDPGVLFLFQVEASLRRGALLPQEIAHFLLLCKLYTALTHQSLLVLRAYEPEEEEELLTEPEETTEEETLPIPEIPEPETPISTSLVDLYKTDIPTFLEITQAKLKEILACYYETGKITQALLTERGILTRAEWDLLLKGERGLFYQALVVCKDEQGTTIPTPGDPYTLFTNWIQIQTPE